MVQFQNVMCDGNQKTFCGNIPCPAQQKLAEIQVFLRASKDTLRLDGRVTRSRIPSQRNFVKRVLEKIPPSVFGEK